MFTVSTDCDDALSRSNSMDTQNRWKGQIRFGSNIVYETDYEFYSMQDAMSAVQQQFSHILRRLIESHPPGRKHD